MKTRALAGLIIVALLAFGGLAAATAPIGPSQLAAQAPTLDERVAALETRVGRLEGTPDATSTLAPAATSTPAPTATFTPAPPTATFTPAPPTATFTPVPPTATPAHDTAHWHPPSALAGHDHGDAPPAWLTNAGYMPMFAHPANTPNENLLKHTGFKAFSFADDGVNIYLIMHLDSNPNGHTSRFHSYQVWAQDPTGAISYWDLWADFGEDQETGPHLQPPDNCGNDGHRPIMMVNYAAGCPSLVFENWYARAGAPEWGWDLGFNIQAQYYNGPTRGVSTNGDLANLPNWLATGQLNATRRVEMAWYASRPHPTGDFWSTQWGDIVSGPADPVCGTTRSFGAAGDPNRKTFTVLCLRQHIALTMGSVTFPANSVQKQYPMTGVVLPN